MWTTCTDIYVGPIRAPLWPVLTFTPFKLNVASVPLLYQGNCCIVTENVTCWSPPRSPHSMHPGTRWLLSCKRTIMWQVLSHCGMFTGSSCLDHLPIPVPKIKLTYICESFAHLSGQLGFVSLLCQVPVQDLLENVLDLPCGELPVWLHLVGRLQLLCRSYRAIIARFVHEGYRTHWTGNKDWYLM